MICALILLKKKRAFVEEGQLGGKGGMQSSVQKMPSETKSSAVRVRALQHDCSNKVP